ncbi:energy transducer TonB [Stutzerimonas azotifigens]|uniref:energy transducer TonB n=1 Tax=Stutzerimonas azotifigens TaxID=291995 RepID=UPI0003FE4639|nr:energy transducer TonB [Stutzerimonas azotifigens]
MSSLTLTAPPPAVATAAPRWRPHLLGAGISLALHALAVGLLVQGFSPVPAEPAAPMTLRTQLISLPPPAPPAPPEPVAAPAPEPAAPEPQVEPEPPRPAVDEAALARKRLEAERIEQRRQAAERERQERLRQQREQEQRQRERQARERAEAEAREAAEREAQRLAEQRAAEAATRAEAERLAASRAYEPIRKSAPDYPSRALDKRIEGDCTVRYSVDAQGRVQNPEAEPDCHPLFIRPSLAAAKNFRYQPRIVDGRPVAVPNVRNTFHYRIE